MPKTKISEFSATANSNTDINSINIAEGCAPSNINDAIRELMAELKDFQAGTKGDSFNGPVNGTVGATTPASGAFTTLSASGVITSTVSTGTAPLTIASTTKVTNLNADQLDGADWASPASIGSTTPAAGAFTTLSSTGNTTLGDASGDTVTINGTTTFVNVNPTLSAGTANGVLYLNGSKVATSGSALTFDGTSLGVGGVPTIQGELNVFKTGSAPTLYVQSDASNSTTQGIIRIGGASGRSASIQGYRESGGSNYHALRFYSYNAADQLNYEITSGGTSIWSVGGSEQMRLTSTGLGIGTSSPAVKLHVSGAGSTEMRVTNTTASLNAVVAAGTSSMDFGTNTNHRIDFYTNSSLRATLDTAGNLGLGVTPSAWATLTAFQVKNGYIAGLNNRVYVGANNYYDGTNSRYIASDYATRYYQNAGQHIWETSASGTAGNAITFTQAMTLDASGNLGVGTTSMTRNLNVGGSNAAVGLNLQNSGTSGRNYSIFSTNSSASAVGALGFYDDTAGAYRMVIDSSGNVLINVTSGAGGTPPNSGFVMETGGNIKFRVVSNGSAASQYYNDSGTVVGSVVVNASSTSYNTSSDYRLKEAIQPMTGALAKVQALKPVTYKWKSDGSDGEGFIAHELAEVVPQCVTGAKDAVDADGNPVYQGIDTSFLVATLTAALQEAVAEINSLKARLDAANL
jgi:Chaperone of endosialidase